MKFFNKRAATAMLLALSMMGTCISPAFAEGSREFNQVPVGSNVSEHPANRPYFEWRDRGQFNMPSRNIMYVYAKAGETIYFGSDVVTANDKSIEAIARSEVSFTQTLNSTGKAWAGSSIAVTLPVSDSEAWNPVPTTPVEYNQSFFDNLFVEGSKLENNSSPDTSKVYLFKPTENGKGHIANPTMEQNGPNGVVRKTGENQYAATATTDGYEPLSFVAPYTGTYSFRFLAREFTYSDGAIVLPRDPDTLESYTIDFQGMYDKLATGAISSAVDYYEPGFGTVKLTPHTDNKGIKTYINSAVAGTKAPATAYSKEVTYTDKDVYFQTDNGTAGRGSIIFTPLHDNVELEIVWDTTGQNERDIVVVQNGVEERIRVTDGADLTVTRISSIKGNPIVADAPVTVYAQTINNGNNNGDWKTNYYEIRYYYDRTELPKRDPDPAPTPTPTPSPTPVPTTAPTPVPTPIAYEYVVDFDDFDATGIATGTDGYVTDYTFPENGLYDLTLYGNDKDRGYKVTLDGSITPVEGGETYTKYISLDYAEKEDGSDQFLGTVETDGVHDNTSARMMSITPKHDNVSVEITWSTTYQRAYLRSYMNTDAGVEKKGWANYLGGTVNTTVIDQFTKGVPTYILFGRGNANIYQIKYIVTDDYPFEAVEKSVDFSSVETHTTDGTETDIIDFETGKVTFYSRRADTQSRGYAVSTLAAGETVTIGETTYSEGHKIITLEQTGILDGDDTLKGSVVGITPKHEGAKIIVRWRAQADSTSLCLNGTNSGNRLETIASGAVAETVITGLPKDTRSLICFDKWGGQIYEIVYSYPGTVVEDTTTPDSGVEVASFFAVDDAAANVRTVAWTVNDGITLSETDEEAFGPINGLSGYGGWIVSGSANDVSYTHNGVPYEFKNGWQAGEGDATNRSLYFTPEDACTVTVAYDAQAGRPLYLYQGDTLLDSGEEDAANNNGAPALLSAEITDPSAGNIIIYGGKSNKFVYGIFVDYAIPTPTPEPVVPAGVNPKPVSFAYTWDFYHMKGIDGTTAYKEDTLIGNYPVGEDGTDYDHTYVYDLKAYATTDRYVRINNKSVFLQFAPEWNDDNTPKSGVLEMIPVWKGTVEVVFETGTVEIKQADGTLASATSENGALTKVTLDVEKNKPVYIYAPSSAYLKAVKYVPETPSYTNFSERRVDDQWVTTPSLVAAWDITVASPETTDTAGTTTSWIVYNEFGNAEGFSSTESNGLTLNYGSDTMNTATIKYNGQDVTGIKMNAIKDNNASNVFKYTPQSNGTITLYAWQAGVSRIATIAQGVSSASMTFDQSKTMKTVSLDVVAGQEVLIYGNAGIYFYQIDFTPYEKALTGRLLENTGRVWTDILFLNAGNFQSSIYPEFNVLTKDGFLYDVRLNGIQPWSFAFYSNNRGFLFDPWSLYTKPELSLGEGAAKQYDRLQALEHSFYSYSSASDVGTAPVRIEKDANNNPILYNGNIMESRIDGNYIPVDTNRDATHKIFFNSPDEASLKVYTDPGELKVVTDQKDSYAGLLENIYYEGLGNAKDNSGGTDGVNYGTEGIGGRFMLTVSAEEAIKLKSLGSNSVSILLDFSKYDLNENATPIANVPVLDDKGEWKKIAEADLDSRSEFEKNNKVSLSAVIDTGDKATEDGQERVYIISWDGRDAYGNVVPPGVYGDNIKSFIEMGMAHFPILDAEHNPNGIKIRMVNEGNKLKDYIYYNNEAVSPRNNPDDPSAWYYASRSNNADYPNMIGDGLNRTAGVSTNFDNLSVDGGMAFGQYQDKETGYEKTDGGYGNFAGLDIWSKYEMEANAKIQIGVKAIEVLKPYVSFVATKGKVSEAEDNTLPFKVSHVGYAGQMLEEYEKNIGSSDEQDGEKFGNTISTGFVSKVVATASGQSNDYMTWEITLPVSGKLEGTETDMPSYIKIPKADKENGSFTTQESLDEAEYLAYELYSGLFEDYAIDEGRDEVNLGDQFMPSWEADASLDADAEPGILDIPGAAESAEVELTEEMYIEAISLAEDAVGDYKDAENWEVTINVNPDARLTDATDVQVNQGDIHQIQKIGDSATGSAKIKVKYKLPMTVSGDGAVIAGIVIDNLYAPGATAVAKYTNSELDSFHDITELLYTVHSTTFDGYWKNSNNMYYTKNDGSSSSVTVTYGAGEGTGTAPAAAEYAKGTEITLPINRTLYVEGKTLTGWTDGTNTYAPGATYTVNGDVTLTAVFTENTAKLGDADATVEFDFQRNSGTPVVALQNKIGFLVYQATINGTDIDVKMDIDTTQGGKFANANWNDWAQVNSGTKFVVPVLAGSVVKVGDIYNNNGKYTIDVTEYTGDDGTYTATEAGIVEIIATGVNVDDETKNAVDYMRGFTVTYPAQVVEPERVDSWEVSVENSGNESGTVLMPGLTMLFTDTAANGKYITSNDNGKFSDGVATGTALKYEATVNGELSVSFIDLGTADSNNNKRTMYVVEKDGKQSDPLAFLVNDNADAGKDDKWSGTITAPVTEGTTYYIYAAGTKAHFTGAKFTAN